MISAVLSFVSGLQTKLILYAIAAAVGAAVLGGTYLAGYRAAEASCNAAALRAELATVRVDLANAQKAAADDRQKAQSIEQAANETRRRTDTYVQELESRPAATGKLAKKDCVLDDTDLARGLRKHAAGGA